MSLRLVIDQNIPFAAKVFGKLGNVELMSGREITAASLKDAEILLVRSVTPVTADLLSGTGVRFVGTATIGTDHIDQDYLAAHGIGFASAAGSNANSVAEYVVAALLELVQRGNIELAGKTIGVVGVGNVGRKVVEKAAALGLKVLQNDPPRAAAEGTDGFHDLATLLEQVNILTVHTPLTQDGEYPTQHLIGAAELAQLKPGVVLINTARGPVVDNAALLEALQQDRLCAVLDVWEGEPSPDPELVQQVDLASPHIAGYSFDGKAAGTGMMWQAVCDYLGHTGESGIAALMPGIEGSEINLDPTGDSWVNSAVTTAYRISQDDVALRGLLAQRPENHAAFFDQLRKQYPVRREFPNYRITNADAIPDAKPVLAGLGFEV